MNPEQVRDAMVQWQLSRLSPRPIGLMQETASSLPVALGSASWKAGIASAVRAAVTRAPVPPASMSLHFGWPFDVAAPLVEVTTH